mgnify:CR=1 FL=1
MVCHIWLRIDVHNIGLIRVMLYVEHSVNAILKRVVTLHRGRNVWVGCMGQFNKADITYALNHEDFLHHKEQKIKDLERELKNLKLEME